MVFLHFFFTRLFYLNLVVIGSLIALTLKQRPCFSYSLAAQRVLKAPIRTLSFTNMRIAVCCHLVLPFFLKPKGYAYCCCFGNWCLLCCSGSCSWYLTRPRHDVVPLVPSPENPPHGPPNPRRLCGVRGWKPYPAVLVALVMVPGRLPFSICIAVLLSDCFFSEGTQSAAFFPL